MRRHRHINSYARRGPVREPYDRVLIVCEGSKTEPNYFNGIVADHRISSANVRVTNASGTDPMSVVARAEDLSKENEYDRVYCVFDRDGHANFNAAMQRVRELAQAQNGKWRANTSTPCFELWLLLHYNYSTAPIERAGNDSACDRATKELRKHFPDYAKGRPDIYERCKAQVATAITHGTKLVAYNTASGSNNPSTNVHELVDYLRKLKPAQ